jgi:hypothetical protein
MKSIQLLIFIIAVLLLIFCCTIAWEYYQLINSPAYNPNEQEPGLASLEIYGALVIGFIVTFVAVVTLFFLGKTKIRIHRNVYRVTILVLIIEGVLLLTARQFQ